MVGQNLHHRNGHLVSGSTRLESSTMEEHVRDSTRTMTNSGSTPHPLEKDGLMQEGEDIAAKHHDHPPNRSMHQHHSSDSDFWSTVAGVAGNVLEWYDFAVFGFFGDVIGNVFFPPSQTGDSSTIEAFAVFGLAFFFRPVGGMLMGYIGDLYGPKKALIISIFLMAFPTFAMGCLPSYEQVGPLAIVLLIVVRILQGLSVGGQLMSSLVFTLENHDHAQWGLYGSYVMAAANFGTLLGSLAGTVIETSLTEEQVEAWGWRIPFLSGIVVSFSGFYLRSHGEKSHGHGHSQPVRTREDFTEEKAEEEDEFSPTAETDDIPVAGPRQNPLLEAFRASNRRSLLAASLVPMLWSGGFYLSFVWMIEFMKDQVNPPVPNAFAVNTFSLLLSVCILFPLAGILSDRFGRLRIMNIGGISLCVLSPFLIYLISRGHAMLAFCAQCTLGVALSLWGAPMCAWLVESFHEEARLTSVAIGYNVAQAVAGGLAPSFATFFVDKIGPEFPGFMLTLVGIVALTGLWVVSPSSEPYGGVSRVSGGTTSKNASFSSVSRIEDTHSTGTALEMVGRNLSDDDELI